MSEWTSGAILRGGVLLVVLGGGAFLLLRRHGRPAWTLVALGACAWIGIAGASRPYVDRWFSFVLAAAIGIAAISLVPARVVRPWIEGRMGVGRVLLSILVFGIVFPFGAAEALVEAGWRAGVVTIFDPTRLVLGPGLAPEAGLVARPGTEDWRLGHIVGDHLRELDPVTFWRSRPVEPYNAQRFKGPLVDVPKPADVFRVMCYGDSNTDGPPGSTAWPTFLERELRARSDANARRFESLNAGVAGWSSYQGRMRLDQEIDEYTPDLVLVSFGWNDLPPAVGRPDRAFVPPSPVYVAALRAAARSRFFLWLKELSRDDTPAPRVQPRVDVAAYAENLEACRARAAASGSRIAFLTRPYRSSDAEQRLARGWRGRVPAYNDRLRAFARHSGAVLIEVQRHFESLGDEALFYDECHFSTAGHAEMARFLARELESKGLLVGSAGRSGGAKGGGG